VIDIGDARFAYDESGSGRALLCLHGGWGRAVMPFEEASRAFASKYRVIAPDRRGYGESSPAERFDVGYHEEAMLDLRALLEALGLVRGAEPPILWGHSDGAVIAALYGSRFPDDVSALVLEAVHYRRRKSIEFFSRLAADPNELPAHVLDRIATGERNAAHVIRRHSQAWLDLGAAGGSFYGPGILESIRCPVLVLHGAKDIHTPVEEIEELARRIARVEVEILPQGGHCPHSERETAAICTARVARFLDEHGI
jgi:pimeloyl-ACP methyl ester carboxylesterase